MIETYGKTNIFNQVRFMVKDRFTITDNMRKYSKFEIYKPKLNKKWLVGALFCVIAGVITTPIPLTGAALYPMALFCFRRV